MYTEGTASRPPTAKRLSDIGVPEDEVCTRVVAQGPLCAFSSGAGSCRAEGALTFRSAGWGHAENADLKVGATRAALFSSAAPKGLGPTEQVRPARRIHRFVMYAISWQSVESALVPWGRDCRVP
jgi:hypothetical protein